MKRQLKNQLILLLNLALFWVLPARAMAVDEPWLRLSTANLNPKVGQEVTIALLVENAPLIYGVESHLTFDPAALEVVALEHGNFLSPDPASQTFILQNQTDNKAGTIDYALTLLNPAPPVKGSGLLASLTFRAKAGGPTTIQVKEALFGTQVGEEIIPLVENAELMISDTIGDHPPISSTAQPAAQMPAAEENPALELPTTTGESNHSNVGGEDIRVVQEAAGPPRFHAADESNHDDSLWLGLSVLGLLGIGIVFIGLLGIVGLMGGWFLLTRARYR
ncbi:MAG: hypothetical protein HYR94_29515 [Chloroflexi bacterium]|nr:hypothetical protein [Chloroflexota bacterium]